MEHWWNDIDKEQLKYSDKNMSQCHFVHHKSHKNRGAGEDSSHLGYHIISTGKYLQFSNVSSIVVA